MKKNMIMFLLFVGICFNLGAKEIPTSYFIDGKTLQSYEEQIDYNTSNNSSQEICFLNNVIVSINENSKFSINQTYAEYDFPTLPSVIKLIKIRYTLSVMSGVVDIVNGNTNNVDNNVIIHTPRINMILNRGQFRVIADKDTTVVAVYAGSVDILNVLEGKKFRLSEINCGIITKHIPLSTKDANFYSVSKSTISQKPILSDDMDKLKSVFDKLVESLKDIIFVVIDNKVYGVKTN